MSLVILHIIPTMGQGGAERLLHSLAKHPAEGQRHIVLTLFDEALFCDGIDLRTLGLTRRQRSRSFVRFALVGHAIRKLIKSENVRIVNGWLYYGMLATLYARPYVERVVWSIHNTSMPAREMHSLLALANIGCRVLSHRIPNRIIYCAQTARAAHEADGYRRDIGIVLDSGVDIGRFYPKPREIMRSTRSQLGFREDDEVVGIFARFHPQKDLSNTFAAVAKCAQKRSGLKLLMAGSGMTMENAKLAEALERAGLTQRVTCIGVRTNMDELLGATDLVVSGSAYAEAMPMILLEALCCGVPIAATEVGDISRLDIPRSALVPISDPLALAAAIGAGLDQGRESSIWQAASVSTRRRFSVDAYRSAHASFYESLW